MTAGCLVGIDRDLAQEPADQGVQRLPPVAAPGTVWWETHIRRSVFEGSSPLPVVVDQLVFDALAESAQIRVLRQSPLIEETRIDEQVAERERFLESLQLYLLDVVSAYWGVYSTRGVLLQRQRLYPSALDIVEQMKLRDDVDTSLDQIIRAEAAAAKRRADLIRAGEQLEVMRNVRPVR